MTTTSNTLYPEEEQLLTIKPKEFYEREAEKLNWFYHVDHQGRIYAEDTIPKNIATSIKAPKFLDFFFRQIRLNKNSEFSEYQWYSPCGNEHNYIKATKHPVVFQELKNIPKNDELVLVWGATLNVPFEPSKLRLDNDGFLYHPLKTRRFDTLALIKSSVGVELANNIIDVLDEPDRNGTVGTFEWNGVKHAIHAV